MYSNPKAKSSEKIETTTLLGDGHQAKVYAIKPVQAAQECVKVFEPFKDKDQLFNAEIEFNVS